MNAIANTIDSLDLENALRPSPHFSINRPKLAAKLVVARFFSGPFEPRVRRCLLCVCAFTANGQFAISGSR